MSKPHDQLPVDIIDQLTIDQAACDDQPMVDTQQIRDAFAIRLNEALDGVDDVRRGRGRNVDFHTKLTALGARASSQATHKWLRAESMPEKDNMLAIARLADVRIEWLEYGNGPMEVEGNDAHKSRSGEARNLVADTRAPYPAASTSPELARLHRIAAELTDDQLKLLCGIAEVIRKG